MPVVSIRSLPGGPADRATAATRIARAIGEAAGKPPADIWVVWTDIAPGQYVIAGEAPATQPRDTHPALVEISASGAARSDEDVERILVAAARAIATELDVPDSNVRVTYTAVAPGRGLTRGRIQR